MKIIKFMLMTAAVAALSACAKENVPAQSENEGNIIRFVSIHPSQTKVTDTNFEVNDRIGVYITAADAELQLGGNEVNNEKFTYDGTMWKPSRNIYWNEGRHNVYAYYPYAQAVNDVVDFTFRVALDQNLPAENGNLGGYESSDFLWASATDIEGASEPVALKFSHRMSKVLIKLTKSADYEGEIPSDLEVFIHNTVPVASISLSSGDVSKDLYANVETIKARKLSNSEYTACLVPQNIETRRPLVEIVTSGVSYLMEGKISLKQGYMHTITIELSKNPDQTKIEIGGGIGSWN